MKRHLGGTGACLAVMLGGCTVPQVRYVKPTPTLPPRWTEPVNAPASRDAVADLRTWWRSFDDPLLDRLVDRALADNLDLRIAGQRLIEARADRDAVAATRKPMMGVDGDAELQRSSTRLAWPPGVGVSHGLSAQIDASWEVDLFGRIRRSIEAADADIGVMEEDRRAILTSLLAEIATDYVALRSAQQRFVIADRNVARLKATADVTAKLFRAGLATEADLAQARAEAEAAQAGLPIWRTQVARQAYTIGVLVGGFPGDVEADLLRPATLPRVPAMPASLPSQVLRDRPDIRAEERRLAAATARMGVAVAYLYPRFRIPLTLGTAASSLSNLFSAASTVWSLAVSGSQTLFDDGFRQARVRAARATSEAQRFAYERSLRVAFRDVEDALAAIEQEKVRRPALEAALRDSRTAVDRVERQRRAGLIGYIDLLTAQRSLYDAEDRLAESQAARTLDVIALAKALGGGWQTVYPDQNAGG